MIELDTAEAVLEWALNVDRLRMRHGSGSALDERWHPGDAYVAGRIAENERLRRAFENDAAADTFDINGNAALRYRVYLRDAMKGDTE